MPESTASLRCPGMIDLSGSEMRRLRNVEDRFSQVARAWGFEEVRTPLIEYLHLYTRSGTLSPQLLGRVYSFLDWDGWSGERVVLRPDSTVAVARLYGERYAGQHKRLFYAQPVLRFASADERRETWQVGAEVIGTPSGITDLELIMLAEAVVRALALQETELHISHSAILRILLDRTGWPAQQQVDTYDRVLNGDRSAVAEIARALPGLETGMTLLIDTAGHAPEYVANLRAALPRDLPQLEEALSELEEASNLLASAGLDHTITTPLARDFEYYTGLVFQLRRHDRVLGSGGRYDNLIELVTGQPAPACGFALDSELVATLIDEPPAPPAQIAVLADDGAPAPALQLVKALSERGLPASINPPSFDGLVVEVTNDTYRRGDKVRPVGPRAVDEIVGELEREIRPLD